ncbi:unnamed protein product [Cochlearia groenlandica]
MNTRDDTNLVYKYATEENKPRTLQLPDVERTSLSNVDNIRFLHEGEEEERDTRRRRGKEKEGERDEEEEREEYQQQGLEHIKLPTINFKLNTQREKLLHQAYSTQKKINSWVFKTLEKVKRKL